MSLPPDKIKPHYRDWRSQRPKPEVDFGVWWTFQGYPLWHRWRVSWIPSTGELYACQPHTNYYIELATIPNRESVEKVMDGWANPEGPLYQNLLALTEQLGM